VCLSQYEQLSLKNADKAKQAAQGDTVTKMLLEKPPMPLVPRKEQLKVVAFGLIKVPPRCRVDRTCATLTLCCFRRTIVDGSRTGPWR